MKTLKMLPYRWKTAGWVLLALCLVLFVACFQAVVQEFFLFSSPYNDAYFGADWAPSLIVIFFAVGMIILAFSQERQEDERIATIRQQALVRTVILYLIVLAFNVIVSLILARVLSMQELTRVMLVKRYFIGVPAFILYYLLIFKVFLWSENKKLSSDEE